MQSLLYATRKHSVWVFFCYIYSSFTTFFLISSIWKRHTIFVENIKEKLEVEPTEEGGNYNERTYELRGISG